MKKIKYILKNFCDLFEETENKTQTLIELSKEITKQDKEKNQSSNRYDKDFSASKKFIKNINEETRSQVSFKISEKKDFTTFFDDSKSLHIDNFEENKKNMARFKKKDLDNLSPRSIKSQMSGAFNFQHNIDDNMSHLTYGVIQEETDIYNSSQESQSGSENLEEKKENEDNEQMEKAESIRAQKDFGLMAKKLQHKFKEVDFQVKTKRRQLGVLCDRLGRLLIDFAPHLMVDSFRKKNEESNFGMSESSIREDKSSKIKHKLSNFGGQTSEYENYSHLNNISMMTFEGSLYSGGRVGLFDNLREKRLFDDNSQFNRTLELKQKGNYVYNS